MTIKRAVLHAAKFAGIFALVRAATRKYPRILCYHGGNRGDERAYNPKLFCTREQLRQRLEWLRRKGFVPVTLDELASADSTPRKGIAVAITLDDGWYSSWHDLLPSMAEYGHRPVLYLHTEAFEAGTPIIPVSIRYILWKAGPVEASLAGFGEGMDGQWKLAEGDMRRRLCAAAERWLLAQAPQDIAPSLERFAAALGVSAAQLDLGSRRFHYMSGDELRAASAAGCAIELHGHIHEYVPGQPERNRANIEKCRERILAAGLPMPTHYCYPSGSFDSEGPRVMREAGVSTATTCLPGLVRLDHPDTRYLLPRFLDGDDVSMIEFEAEMSGVLELLRRMAGRKAH